MEIGFPCLEEPDKVITRLFCDMGFLDTFKNTKTESDENWTPETIKKNYTETPVIKLAIETGMEITKYMDSK